MSHPSVRCSSCGAHVSDGVAVLGPIRVAQLFGVSRRTVYEWVRSGRLPSLNPGGVARIPADAIQQLLAAAGGAR